MTGALPLQLDVPCLRCRYDLRGLDPQGQCPECGHLIHVSIIAWEEDRRALPPILESDPRWIRAVAEGMSLAVVVFVLMVALAFAPAFMFEWNTTPRKWTLGVACTMWALAWAAAWKLSVRESNDEPRGRRTRLVLRLAATMYLAVPFIIGFAPQYNAGWGFVVAFFACLLAGIVATGAWFAQLGRLAARGRDVTGPIEARLLLFASVIAFVFSILPSGHAGSDSLSPFFRMHLCPLGAVGWLHDLRLCFDNRTTPDVFAIVGTLLPLWSAILCLRLALRFRAAAAARVALHAVPDRGSNSTSPPPPPPPLKDE